jgi:DNA-binding MarR family transcriptional regulator
MSRLPASTHRHEPEKIAGRRLSKLQKRMLCWLDAEERRTHRSFISSHQQLVQALPHAKGNISHSLRLLEARGLVEIGRSPGGQAENVRLTSSGCQKASELAGSYE